MARTLWPGQNAIGQIDARLRRAARGRRGRRRAASRAGAGSRQWRCTCPSGSAATCLRWTWWSAAPLPPAELAAGVRAALKPIVPNLPGKDFRTLQQLVDKAVSPRRFVVLLLGGFALFALILASLGIYGVISYSVNQRTQEIGIRMALGASASRLQAGIIRQTLGLAAVGMLIGAVASWVLARALGGLALRSDGDRSADIPGDARGADAGGRGRRLSAGAPRVADRSVDRPACELRPVLLCCKLAETLWGRLVTCGRLAIQCHSFFVA